MRESPPGERARGPDTVVLVHSSDLHIDLPWLFDSRQRDPLAVLHSVIHAAREAGGDVLLLAGDVFEHNRLPSSIIDGAAECLAGAELPIVILPGNHDPLTENSVYERGRFNELSNVDVIGIESNSVHLESLGLEIWGNAHKDYGDMQPLRNPLPRKTRWLVAAAHGHAAEPPYPERYRPSWLMSERELQGTGADYVALGHWDRDRCILNGPVTAHYSGSPRLTGAVNVVRLQSGQLPRVTRQTIARHFDVKDDAEA